MWEFFRAATWIRACNRPDLLEKDATNLHKNHFLCEKHFEDKFISRGTSRKRLFDQAIPTIFEATSSNYEQQSKRQKTNIESGGYLFFYFIYLVVDYFDRAYF